MKILLALVRALPLLVVTAAGGPFIPACAIPVCAHAQTPARYIAETADSLLLVLHHRGLFNGAVVLGRAGEEVYARGFGPANLAAGMPFTPDTPADGGSIAKTLAAAALLLLEEEGLLHLDDPVQRHLPEYPHTETRVRHLISHTAALPGYDFFDAYLPGDQLRTTARFLDILREQRVEPAFEPGTRFTYDNLGFDVAALLVERATGKTWDVFLREHVFDPLGMEATFLRPARLALWPGVRTMSYRQVGDSLALHDVWDNEGFYGASNLYFSARDLYRWSQSFYIRPVLSEAILVPGSKPPVLRDLATDEGGRSGINLLSWYYAEQGRRYHYPGSIQGFWGYVYRDEDQRYSIVYLSNNNIPQWLRPLLTRALIDIMEGRPPASIDKPAFTALDAQNLGAMVGIYAMEGFGSVTLSADDGHAVVQVGSGLAYPAYFVEGDLIYVPGLDAWIGFEGTPAEPFRRLRWLSVFRVIEGKRIQ